MKQIRNWNEKIQFSCYDLDPGSFLEERYFVVVRSIARDSACTKNDLTSKNIMGELNLTRRQFNFRISRLYGGQTGSMINNQYSLTEFGEEAYNAIKIIENVTRVQAMLKAVDIVKFSECSVDEDMDRIINTLIHNEHLRELIRQTSLHQRLQRSQTVSHLIWRMYTSHAYMIHP